MRDFFARQEEARGKSRRLYVLFALAVVAIVLLVYGAAWCGFFWARTNQLTRATLPFWDWPLLRTVALPTLLLILGGSWYKISELRDGGGRRVAELLGGRPVIGTSAEPAERQLLNIVEEIAIAAGVPVPDVFLLERERGINAFAAGFGGSDAVICVTQGMLLLLSREEQQGVIAHEFSHLQNGDTLVNIRLMGLLHGLLLIALAGKLLLSAEVGGRGKRAGPLLIVGLVLFILGSIGVFFGNLVKSAISRQREYLADAAAVQFTRNPLGLAGALKKIAALGDGGAIGHAQSLAVNHMYFCNSGESSWWGALATHPPLLERIRLLDPRFDGGLPTVAALPTPPVQVPLYSASSRMRPVAPGASAAVVNGAQALALLAEIKAPHQAHAAHARALLTALPAPLRTAVRESSGACAVVYALLLTPNPEQRQAQLALIANDANPAVAESVVGLAPLLAALSGVGRLPLVDLALPALRTLSEPQYQQFKATMSQLILADGKTTIFEFALQQLLTRQLDAHFGRSAPPAVQIYGIRGVAAECACVLSLMARAGHRDAEQAANAFASGSRLLQEKHVVFTLLPFAECPPSRLIQALTRLNLASMPIKHKLLAACLACLNYDQQIAVAEAELFRAVAEALGCPAPPWLLSGAAESGAARNRGQHGSLPPDE